MYAEEQRKRILNILANFVIVCFEAISFLFVWDKYYVTENYHGGYISVAFIYLLFLFLITKSFNGYKINYMRIKDLCFSHTFAIILSGIIGYIVICLAWSDYIDPLPLIVMCLIQIVFANLWVYFVRHVYLHIYHPRKIIIIYGNYPLQDFIEKLNARTDKYQVGEILNYQKGLEKICSQVLDFEGVVLYDLPAESRNVIMKYCYKHSIRTYVVPKITDIIMKGSDDLHLVDTPLMLSRNQGLHVDQRFVKRTMDILISVVGILLMSPIMCLIALAIKLCDGGPVFYRQIRLTRDGKEFRIFKFRSMKIDAEKNGAQLAEKNDDRVTAIGKFLRVSHLDELPQLFNVFAGDMSVVGPRPERPEIFAEYEETIPEFEYRLKVKAGITGYAQVYGKYNTKPIDKLKMDLTYIQEYSYLLDIKLMLMTLSVVFRKEKSEGVEKDFTKEGK